MGTRRSAPRQRASRGQAARRRRAAPPRPPRGGALLPRLPPGSLTGMDDTPGQQPPPGKRRALGGEARAGARAWRGSGWVSADSTGPLGAGAALGERSRGGLGGFRSLQAKGHGSPRGQRVAAGGLCGSEDWPRALCAWPTGHGPVWGPPDPFWLRGSEASCGSETTLVGGNGATRAGTRGPVGMVRAPPPAVRCPVWVPRPARPHQRDPGALTARGSETGRRCLQPTGPRGPHGLGRSGLRGRGPPWARSPDPPSRGSPRSVASGGGGCKKGL